MENNSYITWKAFLNITLAVVVPVITLICGAIAWGWNTHNSTHYNENLASRQQTQAVEVRLNNHVQRIEDKLDKILDHLMQKK